MKTGWKTFVLAILMAFAIAPAARAENVKVLVASPKMGEFYTQTVIVIAREVEQGAIGYIVNRKTQMTLGRLFPDDAPSVKLNAPVYLGGPNNVQSVWALVGGQMVVHSDKVDEQISAADPKVRYFAGWVQWEPGELDAEIDKGYWQINEVPAEEFNPDKPWDSWVVQEGQNRT